MPLKFLAIVTLLALGAGLPASAMDRWAALSQIESGDNDTAVGSDGEISRFQMKPEVWKQYASTNANWADPQTSLSVATEAMKQRCAEFQQAHQRPPTDFEFYILWNAPGQIEHPCDAVRERAERFCNLVRRPDNSERTAVHP